jgi:hypothetical protein
MNLDALSDDDLASLASGKPIAPKAPAVSLDDLSDDELEQLAGHKPLEQPGLLEKIGKGALDAAVWAGKKYDSYTGAPSRAAIAAYQDGQNPLQAFSKQFGADQSKAPVGYDMAGKSTPIPFTDASLPPASDEPLASFTGEQAMAAAPLVLGPLGLLGPIARPFMPQSFKDRVFQPSARDLIGTAIDVGADPTNLIPAVDMVKGALKGASVTAKGALSAGRAGLELLPAGTAVAKGLDAVGEAPRAVSQALNKILKPTQAADFPAMQAIAVKNGIDPSLLPKSIEFGENSIISRGTRALAEGPMGENELNRMADFHEAVQQAANNQIKSIAGGTPLHEVDAGHLLKQGYDDAVDRLFDNVDFTYKNVIQQAPGIRLTEQADADVASKLGSLEKWANGQLKRGITNTEKGQAQQVLNAVAAVREGNGSLKQTYEAMSQIGRHAFRTGPGSLADIPVDQKKFQELYFTLRDGFINSTADQLGPDVANALIDSNQQITMFNAAKKPIAQLLGKESLAPERLFNSLVLNGDTTKINSLKEILSPEQLQQVKGAVLENLIKRDSDGAFNFRTLQSAMRNKRAVLGALFSPEELTSFGEVVKLGDAMGAPVLSSSGTGASNSFRNLVSTVGDNTVSRAVLDGMTASARGRGVPQIPQALAAPAEAAKGFTRPVRNTPEETAKLMQILGVSSASQDKANDSATRRKLEEIIRKRGQ